MPSLEFLPEGGVRQNRGLRAKAQHRPLRHQTRAPAERATNRSPSSVAALVPSTSTATVHFSFADTQIGRDQQVQRRVLCPVACQLFDLEERHLVNYGVGVSTGGREET